ncbi:MAG TPA: signal peptidase II [Steroidobacteraceae bacterium]|nr:signal peptidase II [Steroidobacteraceae bacterium]
MSKLLSSGLRWWPLGLAALIVDQLSKEWILRRLALHETYTVLPVFDIVHARNYGAAFSFLDIPGGVQRWLFTVFAIVVSIGLLWWLRRLDARTQKLQVAGLMLIVSGALGNVIDRLRHGNVVDFLLVHWKDHWFPAFNVADSCITIGAGLVLLDALLDSRRRSPAGA